MSAYFTDAQRKATKDAGRIAGLEVLELSTNQQRSSYAMLTRKKTKQFWYTSGGYIRCIVLEIYEVDGQPQIEVKATAGNNKLGGDDFDEVLIDYLVAEYKKTSGIDLAKELQDEQTKEAAEKAKNCCQELDVQVTHSSQ